MAWISVGRSWLSVARLTKNAYQDGPSGSADKADAGPRPRQIFALNEIVQFAVGGQQLVLHGAGEALRQARPLGRRQGLRQGPHR